MSWMGYRQRTAGGQTVGYRTIDESTMRLCECGCSYLQTVNGAPVVNIIPSDDIATVRQGDVRAAVEVLVEMGARERFTVEELLRALVGEEGKA